MDFSNSGGVKFGCRGIPIQTAENGACTEKKNPECNMHCEKQKEDYNTVSL